MKILCRGGALCFALDLFHLTLYSQVKPGKGKLPALALKTFAQHHCSGTENLVHGGVCNLQEVGYCDTL